MASGKRSQRPVEPCQRLLFAAERLQARADIVAGVGVAGIERVARLLSARACSNLFRLYSARARACSVAAWFGSSVVAQIEVGDGLLEPPDLIEQNAAFVGGA